jgi:predicted RNase H-like nuclease (RuvC/YqgF family)
MPTAQQKPKSINARRFVALLAGFDTGNASEEEALSKGRAMRRMAADANMRVVDVLELPEVRQALNDQMQPARWESKEMQQALEHITALREELRERTRDVRWMADALARNESGKTVKAALVRESSNAAHSFGAQSWVFELGAVLLALVLLCVAAIR